MLSAQNWALAHNALMSSFSLTKKQGCYVAGVEIAETNYLLCRPSFYQVDMWNSDVYKLELQFSIRETVCTKASGRDPFTCAFKTGPFAVSVWMWTPCSMQDVLRICWNAAGFLKTKPNPNKYKLQHGVVVGWEGSVLGNSSAWSVWDTGAALCWKGDVCLGAAFSESVYVL